MSESIFIEFDLDVTVKGDGSSLWCDEAESKREFQLTLATLEGVAMGDSDYPNGIWELQVFGPTTHWSHYTDQLISQEVNSKLKSVVEEKIGHKVQVIDWSEQGMQPELGWSFDVVLED